MIGGPNVVLKAFQVWSRTFFCKDKVNSCQNMTVLTIKAVNKYTKSKRKVCRQSCS